MSIFLAGLDCCVTNVSRCRVPAGPMPIPFFLLPLQSQYHAPAKRKRNRQENTITEYPHTAAPKSTSTSLCNFEKRFINTLARAGECRGYSRIPPTKLRHTYKSRSLLRATFTSSSNTRQFSTRSRVPSQAPAAATYQVSKEELSGLIDQYADSP